MLITRSSAFCLRTPRRAWSPVASHCIAAGNTVTWGIGPTSRPVSEPQAGQLLRRGHDSRYTAAQETTTVRKLWQQWAPHAQPSRKAVARPLLERARHEFGAVINGSRARRRAARQRTIQRHADPVPRDARGHLEQQAVATPLIDDRQYATRTTIGQRIAHEVDAPPLRRGPPAAAPGHGATQCACVDDPACAAAARRGGTAGAPASSQIHARALQERRPVSGLVR
jgi:hypothetical protein